MAHAEKTVLKISKKIKDEAPNIETTLEFFISEIMQRHDVSKRDAKILFLAALSYSVVSCEVLDKVDYLVENT